MADVFTKQVCREGIPNIWIEVNDPQIRKRQWSRDICIIFLQKIDKQLLVFEYFLFEYLTVSLDKISNKNLFWK